jgi:hypothetical protein
MRTCLTFLLSMMLTLNAAYAASVGICDALEQKPGHASHIGHHTHEHDDDHDAQPSGADGAGKTHNHDHAHPAFSSIPPNIVRVMPLAGHGLPAASPAGTFVSAPQVLIEHPPKATLA